jgi:plasmid maintenance system antidote protein VapI
MKLRNPDLLSQYMAKSDFSQARLGRYADCSRQFIYKLVHGEATTCTEPVARRIEEALGLLPGTLFEAKESPASGPQVKKTRTAA